MNPSLSDRTVSNTGSLRMRLFTCTLMMVSASNLITLLGNSQMTLYSQATPTPAIKLKWAGLLTGAIIHHSSFANQCRKNEETVLDQLEIRIMLPYMVTTSEMSLLTNI